MPNNQNLLARPTKEKSNPCTGGSDYMARVARTECPPHRGDRVFHVLDWASTFFESRASAQSPARPPSIDRFANFITEASARFTVPASWISAIIQIESAGDEHAISPRGAMGLMQLMPGTWIELSVRYELGLDPFDPRDNIMAGTAYVRELRERFGSAGFLAAYHAGPARYEQHLTTGQPLPPETTAYVAAVTPLLDNEQAEHAAFRIKRAVPWRAAPLFVERTDAR
jgi:membrane-bound lytic murein transglycosylase B